jgi:Large eukaryotic DNA virus major capsid protein
MSAGGVFKLIANDGKADRMLMATELLNQRIKDIMCIRARQGLPDPTPTLVDIERTHILFVNAHFKPFAAIGYEYNKVRSTSGNAAFGGSVRYSIPQFGDFFSDMVVHTVLDAVSATTPTAGDIPAFPVLTDAGLGIAPVSVTATGAVYERPTFPTATQYTTYTYNYVDQQGTILNRTTATPPNYVRYCEYPGERLFKKVKFEVNGNPLDDYTVEAAAFYEKFRVNPNKRAGWNRLVGQENPIEAYSDLCTISGTSVWGSDIVGLTVNSAVVPVTPVNAVENTRKLATIVNGAQTPKATQPALDMWIPLLFWFNRDVRLSIPSVSIPFGQRFIDIDLELQNKIVFVAPGNLYLQLAVEVWTNADGTSTGAAITNYRRFVTRQPVVLSTSTVNTSQTINTMDLYINNIFVNPEIHDIYIKRIGFTLIRVYRFNTSRHNVATVEQLLSNLKWPIEYMYCGLRPVFNITSPVYSGLSVTSGNVNEWRDWHRMTRLVDQTCYCTAKSSALLPTQSATPNTLNPTSLTARSTDQELIERLIYPQSIKTLDTVKIQAHGIAIYQEYNDEFFADYLPWSYGGDHITTPSDPGAILVNFSLFPGGTYQPSGHINVSRAREFYFNFTSSYTGASDLNDPSLPTQAVADLLVVASAINFLLISDGSAVLRYST